MLYLLFEQRTSGVHPKEAREKRKPEHGCRHDLSAKKTGWTQLSFAPSGKINHPPKKAKEMSQIEVLPDIVGQERIKKLIEIHAKFSKTEKEPFPHTLLYSPPGWGKTAIARGIAKSLGSRIGIYTGGAIKNVGWFENLIYSLSDGDVLFIDEVHRLKTDIEEEFYSVMQDFTYGQHKIGKFTLVAATTNIGLLSKPFRERFKLTLDLEPYSLEQIAEIVRRHYKLPHPLCKKIAQRSLKTPRIALKIADSVRKHKDEEEIFNLLELDALGLSKKHRDILLLLMRNGKPVGLETISNSVDVPPEELKDIYERDLLRMQLLMRTPRGRTLSDAGKLWVKTGIMGEKVFPDMN